MKNTKRKHLKLCLLLLFMVLGCFAITNVRTTTVQASSRTFKSNGRTYMEKHNDNTLNTVLYQKVSGRYKQVAKSSTYLIYRFSYGKKLYFSSADDETSDIPGVIFEHFLGMWKNSIEFFHIPFFHVQIYQRKELCQWIFHGSCYLSCWVRLQIQSVMFSAVQRKIKLR